MISFGTAAVARTRAARVVRARNAAVHARSLAIALIVCVASYAGAQSPLGPWPQHSRERPAPPVVKPGALTLPVPPPADAIVLFDGTSLAKWSGADGSAARWRVVDGAFEVVAGTGTLSTRDAFGDVQLHIEWMAPNPPRGTDQDRGNSGVFLMGKYELQILDSYNNATYPDGQAASLYGQFPPIVNASRPPGEWQSYDVVFHRPHFDATGKMVRAARFTVFHNGILVQDNMELVGPTSNQRRAAYEAHADRLPITLQDHGHPVRFRNVWARRLE